MTSLHRALVVDSNTERARTLKQLLASSGYQASYSASFAHAVERLARGATDVIVVAASSASEVAPLIQAADAAAIVVRFERGASHAVPDSSWGAHELVAADSSLEVLLSAIERATRETRARRELALLRARSADSVSSTLIGRSNAVRQLRELIGRAAASQRAVLITGEAGVGKDVVARLIHDLSDRASRPFIRVQCSSIHPDLLEAELFGAARRPNAMKQAGVLEMARGGTVVLDEYVALPAALRARIGQAMIQRAAQRIGEDEPAPFEARLMLVACDARTHGAAGEESEIEGLSVLPIIVPPLRERRSDIPLLVQHFRARLADERAVAWQALAPDTVMSLMAQDWPGNIRELEAWVDTAAAGTANDAHPAPRLQPAAGLSIPSSAPWTLDQLERRYIVHILAQEKGNQSRAAERLGIDRRTLYRKLKEYRDDGASLRQVV